MYYQNTLRLKGIVASIPQKVKIAFDIELDEYEFDLVIKRDSGVDDIIKVQYNAKTPFKYGFGDVVAVYGEVITYSRYDKYIMKKRTIIRAYGESFTDGSEIEDEYYNFVEFNGTMYNSPLIRETPKGRVIADFICVTKTKGDHVSFVPCLVWNGNARRVMRYKKGDEITVSGRFQSREYQKIHDDESIEIRTAYEISVNTFLAKEKE